MKISHKVPLIASAIIFISFAGFSASQYFANKQSIYNNLNSRINETTSLLDLEITNWLSGKLNLIDSIAESFTLAETPQQVDAILNLNAGKNAFQLMYYALESDGQPYLNDASIDVGIIDVRQRGWYKAALAADGATLTPPYEDETSDYPMISAVAQIKRGSTLLGVAGGDLNTQTVSEVMNQINFGDSGYVFLIDNTGQIIIHPDYTLYDQSITDVLNGVDIHNQTSLQEITSNNEQFLVKFKKMDQLGNQDWILGVAIDKDIIFKDIRHLAIISIIGTIISVLVCSLLLYFFMSRIVITPIKNLTKTAHDISLGKMDDAVDENYRKRGDEIGDLAEGFERMRKSLALAMNKLRRK